MTTSSLPDSTAAPAPRVAPRAIQCETPLDFQAALRTSARGLGLAAIFGLAIGARYGALSMAIHAVGVPLGLLAAVGLSAPAAAIGLAHLNLPVDLKALTHGAAEGLATTGLVLAGLAPGAVLVTVTCETPFGAAALAIAGLGLACVLGARRLWHLVGSASESAGAAVVSYLMLLGLFLVAALIAARAWWLLLPMLGGPLAGGAS